MHTIDYKPRKKLKRGKDTLKTETQKTISLLIITLSSMITVLAIVFIATTNQTAQKGYALEQAKLKNEHLKTINSNLSNKINISTAFTEIEDSEKIKEMEQKQSQAYISKEDNEVN